MLKQPDSMKALEGRAVQTLKALIEQVPSISIQNIEVEPCAADRTVGIVVHLHAEGKSRVLVCGLKPNGQPRHVRTGLLELRDCLTQFGKGATPIFIAPYLSPEAQTLCRKNEIGFLDLEGNTRIVFDSVFIERSVSSKPSPERRELKSLFKPKSAQVLRILLRDPARPWRITELAEIAGVSIGHVSNVRVSLLDREWAQVSDKGLFLAQPNALLDAWRGAYEPPTGKRASFYTTLHGGSFEEAARRVLHVGDGPGRSVFASFSAAHWLAPYGRTGVQYFYANDAGLERLKLELKLSSTIKGENVVVTVPKDHGIFRDTVEPAPGAICTSLIQTYLDLTAAGERGRESAEHLRQERLTWLR